MRQGRIVALDAPAALRAQAADGTLVNVELASPCQAALETLRGVAGIVEPRFADHSGPGEDQARVVYRTQEPQVVNPEAVARLVAVGGRW